MYFIVDCDWERARTAATLSFLPFVSPGQKYILWTGGPGLEPVVNPPDGFGVTTRDALWGLIDALRPRMCSQSNFIRGQINDAVRRIVSEQRTRSTPFIIDIFTNRPDSLFLESDLRSNLDQIRVLQQGRGTTYVAHSGATIPLVLQRLEEQNLMTVDSVSSAQYTSIISSAVCSQAQSALSGQLATCYVA